MSEPTPTYPTLQLRLECAMVNPPKPLGFGVFNGDKMVGVMTIDELRRGLDQWGAASGK